MLAGQLAGKCRQRGRACYGTNFVSASLSNMAGQEPGRMSSEAYGAGVCIIYLAAGLRGASCRISKQE